MWRCCLVGVFLLGLVASGRAESVALAPAGTQGLLCRAAVATAERANGIPAQLLAAISRVESGRPDPVTSVVHPWPWTINAEGEGFFFDTKAEVIAAVRALQARGVQSIDVGCAQINLVQHPTAFSNLEQAFDPQANANYAARFLKQLYGQTGDWTKAAALYHSATPDLAADYQRKVLAAWPEEQRLAGLTGASPLAQAWSATMPSPAPGFATHYVRMQPPGATAGPRVIMLPAVGGATPPGRSLAAYRAAPVALAFQPPPRRAGF